MSAASSGCPGPVLVVDDDHDIREMIRMALEYEGYEVVVAEHGRAALEKLSSMSRPCLILLDLMMPVMNGFMFLDAQRADPRLADLPIVVISAYAHRVPAGVAGFVPKPLDLDVLLAEVRRHCGGDLS